MATNGLSRAEAGAFSFEHRTQRAEESRNWCLKLLSSLVHEMSQPLTVLAGEIQLALLDHHPETEYRELLHRCAAQTARLSELFVLSREFCEAEKPPELTEGTSVKEALRESVELLQPVAESKGVRFSLEAPADRQVTFAAERLRKLLLQPLKSAVDRSPRGSQVCVVLLLTPDDAICRVTDVGSMPGAEEVARLLDPLTKGAGRLPLLDSRLEWCLAKRIAEACGGSFKVEGNAEHCSVSIALPLCTPDSRQDR